jgi:hypothetical protein
MVFDMNESAETAEPTGSRCLLLWPAAASFGCTVGRRWGGTCRLSIPGPGLEDIETWSSSVQDSVLLWTMILADAKMATNTCSRLSRRYSLLDHLGTIVDLQLVATSCLQLPM